MTKDYCVNEVCMTGKIATPLERSHTHKDVDYYKFYILVPRSSGVEDKIPVMVSYQYLSEMGIKIEVGKFVRVFGEYRSYKKDVDTKKLSFFVYVKGLTECEESESDEAQNNNHVKLEGYVCRKGNLRFTKNRKSVLDVLLAVNRYKKSSYIPCIIWNLSEIATKEIGVGNKMCLTGRIQSREYIKNGEDGTPETRVAYEVSVANFAVKQ